MDFQSDIDDVSRIAAVPKILEVVCRSTGMGFAAVARVTEDRWICCAVRDEISFGLQPGGELKVETTICNEIRQSLEPVVIDHVAQDTVYCGHPTPVMYGFQSYISVPIVLADGSMFGTLCAIDPRPARLNTPETTGMFKLFAELIAFHLDALKQVERSSVLLSSERKTADLREQFIAVLGHDLRNPLASISAGVMLLQRKPEQSVTILPLMAASVQRMSQLIDNVMDLARTRLGSGLMLERVEGNIEPALQQAISELQSIHPDRNVEVDLDVSQAVSTDPGRISRLLSNLLGNALTYGTPDQPVVVRARSDAQSFEVSVVNSGPTIPAELQAQLFQPFTRGGSGKQGLGLGLYIASQIAKAHGGTIEASSADGVTRFTFRMPR